MKKFLLSICFVAILLANTSIAFGDDEYSDDSVAPENAYYTQGMQYLQNAQYSSAINSLKKALRENPSDLSSKISLTNAYISRAAYYNNKNNDYQHAANDLRSALFYMKYYDQMSGDYNNTMAMEAAQKSLENIFLAVRADRSAKAKFESAKKLRAEGEFAASAYEYFQVINDPKYKKNAYTGIGDVMKILGQNQKAVFYYENAVKMDSKNADLHLKLARAYEQNGNSEGAATEYNLALQHSSEKEDILASLQKIWEQKVAQNPQDAEAHANLGVVYQKQQNFTGAMEQYKKAEELNPTNVNTRLNLATLYQAQKNYDGAIASYNSVLDLYPNHVPAHIYKAQCLKELGHNDDAIKEYKLALGYDPDNNEAREQLFDLLKSTMPASQILTYLYQNGQDEPLSPDTYYNFAYELHKANKLDDAIIYYKETLKLNPASIDSYVNLSQVYRQQKNLTEAYNVISGAKKLYPNNTAIKKQYESIMAEMSSSVYSGASKLFEQGSYTQAIAEYNRIQPPTADSLLGIAASYQALGNKKLAIDVYKKALLLDKNNPDIYYYLGSVFADTNSFTTAKIYLEKALALDKTNEKAKSLLDFVKEQESTSNLDKALDLFNEKKYPEALTILNAAIAKDARNGYAYYYRAMVYDEQKKYTFAIVDYQKTLLYSGAQLPLAHYSLAVDLDTVGRRKEAAVEYKKYLATKPEENEYSQYARKRAAEIK